MIIDKHSSTPLYMQIYLQYQEMIMQKLITPQTKLPSIRSFSHIYNVSKTTIEKAYQQLLVEGYIESKPKSGYHAVDIKSSAMLGHIEKVSDKESPRYLNLIQPMAEFPLLEFKKAVNDVFAYHHEVLYEPLATFGESLFRQEIAKHLIQDRNVICDDTDIIVNSGTQTLLTMLIQCLPSHRKIAYLKPLFDRAKIVFERYDYELIGCDTIPEIIQSNPDLIYISPSNLYPYGDVLPINDRLALIHYINNTQTYIIEDDYNHLFRYNAYQIPTIQGLASGNQVIYIGSFARHFLLSMRVSYLIPPPCLKTEFIKRQKIFTQNVSKLDQLSMAVFMKNGGYRKHLRKLSALSKRKNEAISSALDPIKTKTSIQIAGLDSNTHILAKANTSHVVETLLSNAKKLNLYVQTFADDPFLCLVPYSGLTEDDIGFLIPNLFLNID